MAQIWNYDCERVTATCRDSELNLPLTSICEALEQFSSFPAQIRRTAISLKAAELGVAQIHFYAIAHLLGLGGAAW